MNGFEIFNQVNSGEKFFKAIMSVIHPDDCVVDGKGTKFNINGCTWIEEYVDRNKETLIDKSITVEFTDEERTQINGHGLTGFKDSKPIFNNATSIGHFTNAYIEEREIDGEMKKVFIGEGKLDYFRYQPFIDVLDARLKSGETIFGSVEIVGTKDNGGNIIYLNGYDGEGRIPTEYEYSGWAILDVLPSDNVSRVIEMNQSNKEETNVNEEMIKSAIKAELDKSADYESKIAELNSAIAEKDAKIAELNSAIETITGEKAEMATKVETFEAQITALTDELAQGKADNAIKSIDAVCAEYNEADMEMVKGDIESLKEKVATCKSDADFAGITAELNSIEDKICREIVRKQKEEAKNADSKSSEINSASAPDIFSEVEPDEEQHEVSIF